MYVCMLVPFCCLNLNLEFLMMTGMASSAEGEDERIAADAAGGRRRGREKD